MTSQLSNNIYTMLLKTSCSSRNYKQQLKMKANGTIDSDRENRSDRKTGSRMSRLSRMSNYRQSPNSRISNNPRYHAQGLCINCTRVWLDL